MVRSPGVPREDTRHARDRQRQAAFHRPPVHRVVRAGEPGRQPAGEARGRGAARRPPVGPVRAGVVQHRRRRRHLQDVVLRRRARPAAHPHRGRGEAPRPPDRLRGSRRHRAREPAGAGPLPSLLRRVARRPGVGEAGAGPGRVRRFQAQQHRRRGLQARLRLPGPARPGIRALQAHPLDRARYRGHHLRRRPPLGPAVPAGEHAGRGHAEDGVVGTSPEPLRRLPAGDGGGGQPADVPVRGAGRQRSAGGGAEAAASAARGRPGGGRRPAFPVAGGGDPHRVRGRTSTTRPTPTSTRTGSTATRTRPTPTSCSR